ncbi:MAG: hypothetical protein KBA30_08640, partial [Clostridia bacterium]|nr:hypothetical protein [Clostridia bacterium]
TTPLETTHGPLTSPVTPATINPPGTLPITTRLTTLRVVLEQFPQVVSYVYGENAFTSWLQDRTGVQVEFILYPNAEFESKMSVELSSMLDQFDLVFMRKDKASTDAFGYRGVCIPLDESIERYGYHIRARLDADPLLASTLQARDGNVYALPVPRIPGTTDPDATGMRMWIHRGFLDAYGGGMPTTTDELRVFLQWVRDADANGNGDARDEVGWTGAEKAAVTFARPTDFLMNAFTTQDRNGYHIRNGVVRCAMIEEGYREGLRYLSGLMADGLMDPNYPSNDEAAIRQLVGQNGGDTVACVSAAHLDTVSTEPDIQAKYEAVPPLAGPDGKAYAYADVFSGMTAGMIPAGSRQPELAMAWADALHDPEVLLHAAFGVPGTDWQVPASGTVADDGGPARAEILRDVWIGTTLQTWGASFPGMPRESGAVLTAAVSASIRSLAAECAAARTYEPFVALCALPPFAYDPDTQTKVTEWKTNINDFCRSAITDFIYGNLDIDDDAAWSDYIAQLRGLGLDECLVAMQTAFDRDWRDVYPEAYTPVPTRTE